MRELEEMHEFDHRHTVLSLFMCITIKLRMILIEMGKRLPQLSSKSVRK